MIVYRIINKINNKAYIGKTIYSLDRRWSEHCRANSKCIYIRNAIQKYGANNFIIEIICKCTNLEELSEKEKFYIKKYNTQCPHGYNLTHGGDGINGYKFSKESLEKMSESHKGIIPSEATRQKRSESMKGKNKGANNGMYGHKWSQEEKRARSLTTSGDKHPQYGKPKKEETKRKIKLSKKNLMKPVVCVETGQIFESVSECIRILHLDKGNLNKVLKNEKLTIKNMHFKFYQSASTVKTS